MTHRASRGFSNAAQDVEAALAAHETRGVALLAQEPREAL